MAFKVRFVSNNLLKCLSLLLFSLVFSLIPSLVSAEDSFVIRQVTKPQDVLLLPFDAWPVKQASHEGMLIKLSYVRGILDALQYAQVAPVTSGKALKRLEGMDIKGLVEAVDLFYTKNPQQKNVPPCAVILRLLPTKNTSKPAKLP